MSNEVREIQSGSPDVPAIQVEVLAEGDGSIPGRGQQVSMHYVGTFPDGRPFDSSRDRGSPFGFALGTGQVIQGWDLIVAQMQVGDRWKCTIPFQLAYGAQGHPAGIPPRQDLVFDMELLGIG